MTFFHVFINFRSCLAYIIHFCFFITPPFIPSSHVAWGRIQERESMTSCWRAEPSQRRRKQLKSTRTMKLHVAELVPSTSWRWGHVAASRRRVNLGFIGISVPHVRHHRHPTSRRGRFEYTTWRSHMYKTWRDTLHAMRVINWSLYIEDLSSGSRELPHISRPIQRFTSWGLVQGWKVTSYPWRELS